MTRAGKKALVVGGLSTLGVVLAILALRLPHAGRTSEGRTAAPPGLLQAAGATRAQDGLTRWSLTVGTQRTEVEKHADGSWWLTAPWAAPADTTTVEELLRGVATAKVRSELEPHPSKAELVRFGLAPPRFIFEGQARDGARTGLRGGAENPFDGSLYVQLLGSEQVLTVDGSLRSALEKTPFELRDKHVLRPGRDLRRLELRHGREQTVLTRLPPGPWRLQSKPAARLRPEALRTLLTTLEDTVALALPTPTPAEASTLARAPELEVRLVPAQGAPTELSFGRVRAGEERAYALRRGEGREELAEIPLEALKTLEAPASSLVDASVLGFDPDEVREVTFEPPGGPPLRVERASSDGGGADWTLSAPRAGPAQRWKMASWLWALAHLAPKPNPPGASKSLGPHPYAVELLGPHGRRLVRLELGPTSDGLSLTRVNGASFVRVEAERLSTLPMREADVLEPTQH